MLLRVARDLSELVVCPERAEHENILGASRGVPEPLVVWRCQRPVLLTDTTRVSQLEPGLRDASFPCTPRTRRPSATTGPSASWPPTQYPKVWRPNIDTMPRG